MFYQLYLTIIFFTGIYSFAQTEMDTVRILGTTSQNEISKPHSAHIVSKDTVEQQQQTDVNRVLKQVPGVYVQEEDGLGLRPNIGLRGTHPHRSRKVVILEDGVLIGPAPYSAPAAYYTPFMSKIESLEIFKGLASVSYGPNSIGGAINYITRSIPADSSREFEFSVGTFDFKKIRALISQVWTGNSFLLDATSIRTEGFKKIDFGDSSGFKKNDILFKGKHILSDHLQQQLSWKISFADENSDETYLGLSLEDFEINPYRRYAASQKDNMVWDHKQVELTYQLNPSDNLGLWTTLYYHSFHRNWSRLNQFAGAGAPSISDVLQNTEAPANQLYYGVLTGQADSSGADDLIRANNNRYFYSTGLQVGSVWFSETKNWSYQIKPGFRLHEDQIKRRHTEDRFLMRSGKMISDGNGSAASTTNTDTSTAQTLTFEDEISRGDSKVKIAFRYENVSYKTWDEVTDIQTQRSESAFVPGIGYFHQISDRYSVFSGLNQGVTLVGPNDQESQIPEKSINLEVGLRHQNNDQDFFAELIYFQSDYENIKGTGSFSSGCNSLQLDSEFDGGRAKVSGFESRLAKLYSWDNIHFPLAFNWTVTRANFDSESVSANPEWGIGTIKKGDQLPYVPKANYSFSLGTQYKRYSQEFIFNWTGEMYDQSVEANRQMIPSQGVVDWSGKFQFQVNSQIYARIDNILNRQYLVSLRPFGARPGKERSFQVGIKHSF